MRYSEEFRNKVVSRLLAKELSVREAAEQYDVSEFTLYEWKRKALAAVQTDAGEHNGAPVTMDKLRLPKGMSYLQAYGAVVMKGNVDETTFGAYCRKHGILAASVSEWEAWFAKHPNACNADELTN